MGVRDTLAKMLAGAVGGPREGGIAVYHSSPHDVPRFDMSKLRTGEGANMITPGFYFAENPEVSGQGGTYWNQFLSRFGNHEQDAADLLRVHEFDRPAALEALTGRIDQTQARLAAAGPNANTEGMDAALRHWRAQHEILSSGNPVGPRTYEAMIRAEPTRFLNWEQPIRDQAVRGDMTEVARKLKDTSPGAEDMYNWLNRGGDEYGKQSGMDFYRALVPPTDRQSQIVTNTLGDYGIPGVKYRDAGSIGVAPEKRTHNWVVFDSDRTPIDIMAKYGVAAAPVGGAAAMSGMFDPAQYQEPDPLQGTLR